MPTIVVSEFMDERAVDCLRDAYEVAYEPTLVDDTEKLMDLAADARALIVRNRTKVRGALLNAASELECVGRLGVGLDNIDVAACRARDVAVFPATGANDLSVAEYVVTNALMLLRKAYDLTSKVAAGEWPRGEAVGNELAGRTMGLIGFGNIARAVAMRANALGMDVVAYDPHVMANDPAWNLARNVSLDALAEMSDVVSLHVPLIEATRHIVDMRFLRAMKPDAVLINAARGGVVDDAAVAWALGEGEIAGAALDVFETEPLTAEAGAMFADLPNLILTPHIAGVTHQSNARVSAMIADKVLTHLAQA